MSGVGWQMSTHCQRTHCGAGTYRSFQRRARGTCFGRIITGTHDQTRHVHKPLKPRTEHSRNDGLGPRGTDPWP
jgi:hypothetical protein